MDVNIQSQSKDFINKLLYLEEQFSSRLSERSIISSLIECYGQLVEFYDAKKDPIKHYFLEKIQFVLSRPESLRLILPLKSLTPQANLKRINFPQSELRRENQESCNLMSERTTSDYRGRYSISKKKQERAANYKIFVEMDKQHKPSDLDILLQEYQVVSQEYNELIKQQLDEQEETLKRKLSNRSRKRASSTKRNEIVETQEIKNDFQGETRVQDMEQQVRSSTMALRRSINKLSQSSIPNDKRIKSKTSTLRSLAQESIAEEDNYYL